MPQTLAICPFKTPFAYVPSAKIFPDNFNIALIVEFITKNEIPAEVGKVDNSKLLYNLQTLALTAYHMGIKGFMLIDIVDGHYDNVAVPFENMFDIMDIFDRQISMILPADAPVPAIDFHPYEIITE